MKHGLSILVVLSLLLWVPAAGAHTPKGGLGDAAMSPDGRILVVGGDTRALYVLDPATLEVKKRIWIKTNIYEMEFNKDGSTLMVEDTKEILYFIDSATWEIKTRVEKAGRFSAAPAVDLVAGLESSSRQSKIRLLSMTDGLVKSEIEYPGSVQLIAIDAAAKRLALLAEGPRDQEEKKKVPNDLKGLEKKLFQQQHDGRISALVEYDLATGKMTRRQDVFYFPSAQVGMLLEGQTALALTYGNDNALWEGEKTSLFETDNSYNYGAGISPDRRVFVTGGLLQGTYVRTEGLKMTTFTVPALPGWPEYFKGFGFGPDGTAYGVTTGYRLVVIDPQGQVVKAVPIY